MKLKNEKEIIKIWDTNLPLVSISCVAYNHQDYIKDCIESFLNQKTNYPFEILIHDDASEDLTAEIIRQYESKYPNIIYPIYQKINQYSKNIKPNLLNIQRARGKYIAFCDGDDFWSSNHKLSKQVKYMEKFYMCDVSFHGVRVLFSDNTFKDNLKNSQLHIYSLNQIILKDYRLVFSSSSIMIKRDILRKIPKFYKIAPVEDYYLRILGSINGGGLYIPEVLSTYRRLTPNSYTKLNRFSKSIAFRNYIAMNEARLYLGRSLISIAGYKVVLLYLKFLILKFNFFKK
mgnify:CR=1 FL=1|tara:strand:+ start:4565 stop:5428 length:864 start_codon:yes stop_codon:yes gene_type:complete